MNKSQDIIASGNTYMIEDTNVQDIESILYLIFKRKYGQDSLEYLAIEKQINNFSPENVSDFYEFFSKTEAFFNTAGFSSLHLFSRAVKEYKEHLNEAIWRDENVFEKVVTLTEKLSSIFTMMSRSMDAAKADNILEKGFAGFKGKGTGEPLIGEEEVAVLSGGKNSRLYYLYVNEGGGILRDEIEILWKNFITKNIFSEVDNDVKVLDFTNEGEEKKMGTLISRGFSKM